MGATAVWERPVRARIQAGYNFRYGGGSDFTGAAKVEVKRRTGVRDGFRQHGGREGTRAQWKE